MSAGGDGDGDGWELEADVAHVDWRTASDRAEVLLTGGWSLRDVLGALCAGWTEPRDIARQIEIVRRVVVALADDGSLSPVLTEPMLDTLDAFDPGDVPVDDLLEHHRLVAERVRSFLGH